MRLNAYWVFSFLVGQEGCFMVNPKLRVLLVPFPFFPFNWFADVSFSFLPFTAHFLCVFMHTWRGVGGGGFPNGSVVKNLPAIAGDTGDVGSIPGNLEMVTHSNILA